MNCTRCGQPAQAHPAADRLALATRTMKARHGSVCTICLAAVSIGQTIARLINPAAWVHVGCVPIVAALTGERDSGQMAGETDGNGNGRRKADVAFATGSGSSSRSG